MASPSPERSSRSLRVRDRVIQLGAAVLVLSAVELVLRAFVPAPDLDRYRLFRLHGADGFAMIDQSGDPVAFLSRAHALLQPDARTLWRLRPGLDLDATSLSLGPPVTWRVTTTADGWRTTPPPAPDPDLRLLALGDSSTFGWGVDDDAPWPAVLQARTTGLSVHNLAVPGWSSVQGAVLAEERARGVDTDVIVAAFGANDGHRVPRSDRAWLAARQTVVGHLRHQAAQLRFVVLARHHLYPLWARAQVLAAGAGRTVPRADPGTFRDALERMADQAPRTLLVDLCARPEYSRTMQRLADEDARVDLLRYDDVHGETLDGCHPTAPGHAALAGAVGRLLDRPLRPETP